MGLFGSGRLVSMFRDLSSALPSDGLLGAWIDHVRAAAATSGTGATATAGASATVDAVVAPGSVAARTALASRATATGILAAATDRSNPGDQSASATPDRSERQDVAIGDERQAAAAAVDDVDDEATNELADEVTETVRDLDVPVADDLLDDGVVDDLLGGTPWRGRRTDCSARADRPNAPAARPPPPSFHHRPTIKGWTLRAWPVPPRRSVTSFLNGSVQHPGSPRFGARKCPS